MNVKIQTPVKAQLYKPSESVMPSDNKNAAKINENIKNGALNTANDISLDVSGLSGENNLLKEQSTYTRKVTADASVFYNNDLQFFDISEDAVYNIDGVKFNKNEVDSAKNVIKNVVFTLPIAGSNLNYDDYASMGIAINAVSLWADKNLTKEQSDVVKKAIHNYTNNMVAAEKNMQAETGVNIDDSKYYGATISNDETDHMINQLKGDLSKITGKSYGLSSNTFVKQESATNKQLSTALKDLFSNVDLTNREAMQGAFDKYKEMMKPAYQENGLSQYQNIFLSEDISKFSAQISNVLSATQSVGTKRVDISI